MLKLIDVPVFALKSQRPCQNRFFIAMEMEYKIFCSKFMKPVHLSLAELYERNLKLPCSGSFELVKSSQLKVVIKRRRKKSINRCVHCS